MDAPIKKFVQPLQGYVRHLLSDDTPSNRTRQLQQTADFISQRLRQGKLAELMFVCTHNSRRSQFAHVWAETAAYFYELDNVRCHSGGIEVTACNERVIRALRRAGFSVVQSQAGENPVYLVQFGEEFPPVACASKIYSDLNVNEVAAIMCCSDADDKCPVISQAVIRIPLHYDDPKDADDTPQEEARYDERCLQSARDMFQIMSLVVV